MSCTEVGVPLDLAQLIRSARRRLPTSHRALLEQINAQDAVIPEWPVGVQDLYRTIRRPAPPPEDLAATLAAWLSELSVVVYNGPLLGHVLGERTLTSSTRQAMIDNLAWHEYGHALSASLASREMKRDGPRLLELLPPGLRQAVDYPGGYRRGQVFDEVIANVYALLVSRAVHHKDYGLPTFLHPDVYDAFQAVVPWPPERP